jgi:TIGR03009 family protein
MMRLTCATGVAILTSWALAFQVHRVDAQQNAAPENTAVNQPASQPFPALEPGAQAQLQELLTNWEAQSKGTKTLECAFTRWHYDMFAAPAGVHATKAEGVIKYAAPDKGLFRVDLLLFYAGMVQGKPQFKEQPGQYGEHWVCNGTQLIEFDRSKEECRIQDLPPNMQGQQIFNSPLPFVFNLDAQQIQERYWVRQVEAPKPGVLVIEAWPRRQEDRAQYKLVQIALDEKTYLPQALVMYAPNFDAKTAPKWDHYEFTDVKRNAIGAGFKTFLGNFIPEKPPANWKILRDKFVPVEDTEAPQQAAAPDPGKPVR